MAASESKTGQTIMDEIFHPAQTGWPGMRYALARRIYRMKSEPDMVVPVIEYGWPEWRQEVRRHDFIMAIVSVMQSLVLVMLFGRIRFLRLSIIGAVAEVINLVLGIGLKRKLHITRWIRGILIAVLFLSRRGNQTRAWIDNWRDFGQYIAQSAKKLFMSLPKAAMREELMYRWGSENRTAKGRFLGDLSFGLLHTIDGIRPLYVMISTGLGGRRYTKLYLEELKKTGSPEHAVRRAATAHATHNIVATAVIPITILAVLVYLLTHKRWQNLRAFFKR